MNPKRLILQLFEQIYSYNIFVHDEAEGDNNDGQVRDQAKVIKHQRYATRLYLSLFIGVSGFWEACYELDALFKSTLDCLYDADCLVLFLDYFPSLRLEHGETLSCPCSTISILYADFVSHAISFDPVCTSIFTSRQWIEALYTPGPGTEDFRQTASSQVRVSGFWEACYELDALFKSTLDSEEREEVEVLNNFRQRQLELKHRQLLQELETLKSARETNNSSIRIINTILGFFTRPYASIQKYSIQTFQSYLPTQFDEKTWYILFGFLTCCVFVIAYVLSRCVTLNDADDDPVYQRARLYSAQRKYKKFD
ncbi:unnamed protein product [Adineta steineri]|uniref:Uncharacterized protein n=1 Tax=Adineta steineri TaxID=433720 RepID=A0A813QJJ3_9BILA|nr:unnamed protein product [Adineta steineri]